MTEEQRRKQAERYKRWYLSHLEQARERGRQSVSEWRVKNPAKVAEQRMRYWQRKADALKKENEVRNNG